MPLAGVLSAMRELLLDQFEAPNDFVGRCAAFATRFPSLSSEEVEDLAKMPSEKLAIYSQTVFAGERSTLRNHFPLCFALIRQALGDQFDGLKLVRELHAKRPWRSYLTRGLTHNFAEYLAQDRPDLLADVPYLAEVARLEMRQLDAARAPEPECGELVRPSDIASLSVEELMLKRWVLAPSVQLDQFEYDVISYRIEFFERDRALPVEAPKQVPLLAVAGRNRRSVVRWHCVEPGEFGFIAAALEHPRQPFSSEDLAAAYIEDIEGDERELFARFITELSVLIEHGVVLAV